MIDTSQLEKEAEAIISHRLQKGGVLIAKPSFDVNGADLLAFAHVNDNALFCRVQCKGRSVTDSDSSVKVPVDYVTQTFILFLYIKDENYDSDNIYCFFQQDIQSTWTVSADKKEYSIHIPKLSFKTKLSSYSISQNRIQEIIGVIKRVEIGSEYESLLCGGATRRNAVDQLIIDDELFRELNETANFETVYRPDNSTVDYVSIDRKGIKTAYRCIVLKDYQSTTYDMRIALKESESYCKQETIDDFVVLLIVPVNLQNHNLNIGMFRAQLASKHIYKSLKLMVYGVVPDIYSKKINKKHLYVDEFTIPDREPGEAKPLVDIVDLIDNIQKIFGRK